MTKHRLVSGFYWVVLLAVLAALVVLFQHYIDYTDQAFYLLQIAHPQLMTISANFWYLYVAPIYQLLGENVYFLRLAGLFLLLLASLPLGFAVRHALVNRAESGAFWPVYLLMVTTFYLPYFIIPGYNWFNMVGILLFAGGAIRLIYPNRFDSIALQGLLIALGGWLSFAARPPSAAALALMCVLLILYLLYIGTLTKRHVTRLTASAALSLIALVLFHFTVLDNVAAWIERTQRALTFYDLTEAGHGFNAYLMRLLSDGSELVQKFLLPGAFVWLLILGALRFNPLQRWMQAHRFLSLALLIICLAGGFMLTHSYVIDLSKSWWLSFIAYVPLMAAGIFFIPSCHPNRNAVITVIVIIGLTFAFNVSSNIGYFAHLHYQGLLVFLMILFGFNAVLTAHHFSAAYRWLILPGFALLPVALWAIVLHHPFRSSVPVYRQTIPTQLTSNPDNRVDLDQIRHNYINTARAALSTHGFQPGQRLIDLTGMTPLILYLAEATPPPMPWLSGCYDGSNQAASFVLGHVPQDQLRHAWILHPESDGDWECGLDPSILTAFGLHFPDDYERIAEMSMNAIGWRKHSLWKPKTARNDSYERH